ncbi:hypothetical protein DFJ74DRAFT_694184 [Hyaloraphidium curvatum]|nr:hypothetical protein DFJ74DRAFT_694184 [Hyaloraphidium curvatum]
MGFDAALLGPRVEVRCPAPGQGLHLDDAVYPEGRGSILPRLRHGIRSHEPDDGPETFWKLFARQTWESTAGVLVPSSEIQIRDAASPILQTLWPCLASLDKLCDSYAVRRRIRGDPSTLFDFHRMFAILALWMPRTTSQNGTMTAESLRKMIFRLGCGIAKMLDRSYCATASRRYAPPFTNMFKWCRQLLASIMAAQPSSISDPVFADWQETVNSVVRIFLCYNSKIDPAWLASDLPISLDLKPLAPTHMSAEQFCDECCGTAGKGRKLRRCSRCSFACYCSKDCQRQAWPEHRSDCDEFAALKITVEGACEGLTGSKKVKGGSAQGAQ